MPLQDSQVTIDVAYPAARIGLGRPLILAQKTGAATYKEYTSLTALVGDFAANTPAYAKAAAVMNQPNRPDKFAVATFATDPQATLDLYAGRDWHFALLAGDVSAEQVLASNWFNAKDFKMFVAQVSDATKRAALAGKKRTAIYQHPTAGEHLDAAVVGNLASLPVGSITWKFQDVKGITPQYLTSDEVAAIDAANANAYVMKAGKAQLSEGKLANGEYIDVIHGQDWIKADMENEMQNAMSGSQKLPYDARGINVIEAAATTTLKRAFDNMIIGLDSEGLPDYKINTLSRDQSDPQDRRSRIYRGLTFEFGLAGAIHEVRVKGQIRV